MARALLVLALGFLTQGCGIIGSQEIDEEDIKYVEGQIAAEYLGRTPGGASNPQNSAEVEIVKTDAFKGEGYATIRYVGLFGVQMQETHRCSVSKDQDNDQMIYQCDSEIQ